MNYVVDQVVSKLLESAKKKNKGGMDLKPFHIKGHVWVFVNCQIENPSFDSQTKENMTLKVKSFGSTCSLSDKFIKQVSLECTTNVTILLVKNCLHVCECGKGVVTKLVTFANRFLY